MPKSLRLGTELEKALDRYCAETGETTSTVIRQSVAEYIVRRQRKRTAPSASNVRVSRLRRSASGTFLRKPSENEMLVWEKVPS